ncbi:MAG TPA: hypothetical protein VII43_03670 [Opitutaceae bacterium]
MRRYFLHACAATLALSAPAFAADAVTRAQVLDAIRVFDANAAGSPDPTRAAAGAGDAVAKASNTILKFAIDSDEVVVDLGPNSVPWLDVKKGFADLPQSGERGLLFAAYVAGSVKAQLRSGKPDPNPFEGWVAMLQVYRALRTREGVRIPEAEALLSRQMAGTLGAYAASALIKSNEGLRKSYGDPAGSAKVPAQQP